MDYNKYNNEFSQNLKDFNKKSNANQLSDEFKNINKQSNRIKTLPYHESIFEHSNHQTRPYEKTGVCAIFRGVKYIETEIVNVDIRKILNYAIDNYLQFAPLRKVDVNDFIDFVNKTFKVHIVSIDAIDLKRTMSLSQKADDGDEPKPQVQLKNLYVNNEPGYPNIKKRPIEMPEREYVEMPYNNVPVEMPNRTQIEIPNNIPVEMPQRKIRETKTREHTPEHDIEMGM